MIDRDQKDRKDILIHCLICIVAFVLSFTIFNLGHAAEYPNKPVTLIVAFPPGGGADITGRLIASYLTKKWKQSVSVTNVPGGGSVPGTQQALESNPDGYTLLVDVHVTGAMMPAVYENLPFDWRKRIPLGRLTIDAPFYLVNPKSPYKTLSDLAKAVKENPQKFSWGGTGPAGLSTFVLGQFFDTIGVNISETKMVALQGSAPSLTALAGGHINIAAGLRSESNPLLSAGKIRALAVVNEQRLKEWPEVPTVAEAGYPNLDVVAWQGITGPVGLPKDVVDKWVAALREAAKDPEFLAQCEKAKKTVAYLGPEDFKNLMLKEYKKYQDLAKKMDIIIKK
jgi:tripartite-type tricarboxylate transporter receptor subunit TctC